jgi:hypothetical protein
LTPAGNQLTAPIEFTARVSTLTGLGRVFTVGALLVLATWWFSYFRRRRISTRSAGIDGAARRHPTTAAIEEGEPTGEPDHQKVEDPSGMKGSEATNPLES